MKIHRKRKLKWSAGFILLLLLPGLASCAMAAASSKTDLEKRVDALVQSNMEMQKRVDELERKFKLLESTFPSGQPSPRGSTSLPSTPPSVASTAPSNSPSPNRPATGVKNPTTVSPPSGMPVVKLRPPTPPPDAEPDTPSGSQSGEGPPPLFNDEVPGVSDTQGEAPGDPGNTPSGQPNSPSHHNVAGAGISVDAATMFESAMGQYEKGEMELAIEAFRLYLTKYPESAYAPGAMFYLGESFYKLHKYPQATENYRRLLMKHPDSEKAPDALFKLGMCFLQVNDVTSAKQAFNRVIEQYPNSVAAKSAQDELKKLQ